MQDLLLCLAIDSDIMGQIASWAQHNIHRISQASLGENVGDHVVPG